MRIGFLGLWQAFDFHHIGGVDSTIRRLAGELVRRGLEVDFIHYDAPDARTVSTALGLTRHYFYDLGQTLKKIRGTYDHLVTIYLRPRDRLHFALFRYQERKRTRFHQIYFSAPESSLKRQLMFADERLMPHNGSLFAVSPRLQQQVPHSRGKLLLPPVPKLYFLSPEMKQETQKTSDLRITYMGRVSPAKGTLEAAKFFQYLHHHFSDQIKSRICGYPWGHKPETIRLHEWLLEQDDINYEPQKFKGHSNKMEGYVAQILKETDVLYLPYQKLSSTIDMPLLLLEGMASLSVVMTRPFGNMPQIYGSSQFMVDDLSDYRLLADLLLTVRKQRAKEWRRLAKHSKTLAFDSRSIAETFLAGIGHDG